MNIYILTNLPNTECMANGREDEKAHNNNKICMIYKRGAAWKHTHSLHRVSHGLDDFVFVYVIDG